MYTLLFITGNAHKAEQLGKWLGHPVDHRKLDLDELQTLNLEEIIEHKVRQAYAIAQQPVIVEDASLTLLGMGKLPGTYIKWFLEELGNEGIIKLADAFSDRRAVARLYYAYYDGERLSLFEGEMKGTIATEARGDGGFGFDKIFINDGYDITRAEMDEASYAEHSYRAKAIAKLAAFLNQE